MTTLVGKLKSHYCGDAGYNADWDVGDTDLIGVLWNLEGKVVRVTIEVLDKPDEDVGLEPLP